jgi:hypothetical protein
MFDLDQQLSKWRTQMLAGNVCLPSDIEELEGHLLEAMDDLESKGLTREEAFWVATHRIGDVNSLNREFGKINRGLIWRRYVLWLLAGYIIISAIHSATTMASRLFFLLGSMSGAETSLLNPVSAILRICLIGGVLFLLFSKKAGDSSVMKRSISLIRNHYLMFFAPVLILITVGKWIVNFSAARALGSHGLGQMAITEAYVNRIWLLLLYVSFLIVFMLLKRARKSAAER